MNDASKAPTKVVEGSDFHLTLLMAPMSLNLVMGSDRQALLDYAKSVWQASRKVALESALAIVKDTREYTGDDVAQAIKELMK